MQSPRAAVSPVNPAIRWWITHAILPHVAPSNVYPCSDGVSVIIAANADNVFRRLCETMGRPELALDGRFAGHQARGEHQEEIDAIVAAWTERIPSAELMQLMDEAGVEKAIAKTYADAPVLKADALQYIYDACKKYPDRLIPYARINPHVDNTGALLEVAIVDLKIADLENASAEDRGRRAQGEVSFGSSGTLRARA